MKTTPDIPIADLRADLNGKRDRPVRSRIRPRAPRLLHRVRPPAGGDRPRSRRIRSRPRSQLRSRDRRRARGPQRRPQPRRPRHIRGRDRPRPLRDERGRDRCREPHRVGAAGCERPATTPGRPASTASPPGSAIPPRSASAASPSAAASASWSARTGSTIDDVLGAEVVTADGELLERRRGKPPRPLLGAPGRRRQLRRRHRASVPAPRDR